MTPNDIVTPTSGTILDTERLVLRRLVPDDAAFILRLLNDPGWLRFIGDKGVRTIEDARGYILEGPMRMYARDGFGLWLVLARERLVPLGLCGLIKRDGLDDVDIGYAFLPEHRGRGYALEAGRAVIAHARDVVGLRRLVAIVIPDNRASIALLERLGLRYEGPTRLGASTETLSLYGCALTPPG